MKGNRVTKLPLFGAENLVSVPRITGFRSELLQVGTNGIVYIGPEFQELLRMCSFEGTTQSTLLVLADVDRPTPEFNYKHLPPEVTRGIDLVDVVALTTRQPFGEKGPHGITVQGMAWMMNEHPAYAGLVRYWYPTKGILIPGKGEIHYGENPGWVFEALKRSEGEYCLAGMKFLFRWV